jgi:TolB-like protein
MPADIFISYSRKDAELAFALAEKLRSSGATVWMDTLAIVAAQTWSAEIVNAIKECKALVVLLSPDSVASHNVTKEVALASEMRKTIVPIDVSECELNDAMIYALAGLHRISYHDEEALLRSLEKHGFGAGTDSSDADFSGTDFSPSKRNERTKVRSTALRIAVLPFDDLSPSKDNDWFADGMMDELITTLDSLDAVVVCPRTDVLYYKGKHPKLQEIVADLGVTNVIEGSVQKILEKIRINVTLTDARKNERIWSEKYHGTFDDVFELQDKTCFAITEALRISLTPEDEKKIERRPTDNTEAYELLLKATQYYDRQTRTDYERALQLYEVASKLDPLCTTAFTGIASASLELYRSYSHDPADLKKAEDVIAKMTAIEGETARSFRLVSNIESLRGNNEEALLYAQKSLERDPDYSPAYQALGLSLIALGRLAEAADARERCVQLAINNIHVHFGLLIALDQLGDKVRLETAALRAIPYFEKHLRVNPEDVNAQVQLTLVLYFAAKPEEAKQKADELVLSKTIDGNALYNLTCLYLKLSEPSRALATLRKSIDAGFTDIKLFRTDPDLALLRETPEFDVLIGELEEKIENQKSS